MGRRGLTVIVCRPIIRGLYHEGVVQSVYKKPSEEYP
ncbi:hypothetical protein BH23GEM8_BH23GEM8_06690 [soil metagenome]